MPGQEFLRGQDLTQRRIVEIGDVFFPGIYIYKYFGEEVDRK